jgi:hypothetical protein
MPNLLLSIPRKNNSLKKKIKTQDKNYIKKRREAIKKTNINNKAAIIRRMSIRTWSTSPISRQVAADKRRDCRHHRFTKQ